MRIHLRIYVNPGEVQVFCNLLRKDGNLETITATIDTGAGVCLFPNELLDVVASRPTESENIVIDQVGISGQFFEAIEAYVTISLEDEFGNVTPSFEIPAWFAATKTSLIGFAGVLDRAVLHIDMLQHGGWLEIEN